MLDIGYNGRLGNQMFQLAALFSLARRRGFDLRLPQENLTRRPVGPSVPHNGSRMLVKLDLLDAFLINPACLLPVSEIRRRITCHYNEATFNYEENFWKTPDNANLRGYFQSPKYFSNVSEGIRRLFTFHDSWRNAAEKIVKQARSYDKELVSLHVRRTDYLHASQNHYSLGVDYYSEALSRFPKDVLVLIFSDDINWCKEKFSSLNALYIDSGSPYTDLQVMVLCDHHIIANSSYSWWGAWLNPSPTKTVIAPAQWFTEGAAIKAVDIYPPSWTRL